MRGGRAAELVALLILALGTWLGFATSGPPSVRQDTVATALPYLQAITRAPHALGSAEHDRVRDYLVDKLRTIGFDEVHIQSATGFNTLNGPLAATIANVVARKKGRKPGPAILLSAHYDAVPRSFGAGDDGVGVAAILGALTVLANGPPLDHDLIITFVDAEEEGLLGAEAFVDLHPWAKDVGVALNFEGRGNRGPVYMFQTSPGNSELISALSRVDGARANSLSGEVYRHLPSDTDLSIWLHSGFAVGALNFAHVAGFTSYHTPNDNVASLDLPVLQQMGDYALTLVRTLDATDLHLMRGTDAIYFDAPLVGLVRYPGSWALIMAIDAFALVLLLLGFGWYRRTLTLGGIAGGTIAMLVTMALPAVVALAAWRLIRAAHPGFREILQGDPYNSLWYLLAIGAFTVAVAVTVQRRASTHLSAMEAAIAPMLLWGILGVLVAIKLPGASYLFVWPLFAATMCASWWRRSESRGRAAPVWLALLAIPALVLWPPLVMSLEVALTATLLPICALLLAMVLSLLSMPLQLIGTLRRWVVVAALVVAAGALIRAELAAGFNESRKRPDSLSYVMEPDSARAWWVSFDRATDSWTARVLGEHPTRRAFHDVGLTGGSGTLLATSAATPVIPTNPVQLLANEPVADGRRIHLHIARTGAGEQITLLVDSATRITHMVINGRVLADRSVDRYSPRYQMGADGRVLRYFGVPEEGVDLWFTIAGTASATLRIVTATEGLPATATGPVSARPVEMVGKPFVPTDMTIAAWALRI